MARATGRVSLFEMLPARLSPGVSHTAMGASQTRHQQRPAPSPRPSPGSGFVTTRDGATQLYYKDLRPPAGEKQTLMFHHGWPLSADDWDAQAMFFFRQNYRVVAFDRRGHGRSTQTVVGNDMTTYANDVDDLVRALRLSNVVHVGHSAGGGEVVRYVANYGQPRTGAVAKAVLISSVPPLMLRTPDNPRGEAASVFDSYRKQLARNRTTFYDEVPMPFYGFNHGQPDPRLVEAVRRNWWRQGMMGGAPAQYDNIKAFSETDFSHDLMSMQCPTLILQGDADQIVPYQDASLLQAQLIPDCTLRVYPGFPHGMHTIHPDVTNEAILAFVEGRPVPPAPPGDPWWAVYPFDGPPYSDCQGPYSSSDETFSGRRSRSWGRIQAPTPPCPHPSTGGAPAVHRERPQTVPSSDASAGWRRGDGRDAGSDAGRRAALRDLHLVVEGR